jgi:hypothetical protein
MRPTFTARPYRQAQRGCRRPRGPGSVACRREALCGVGEGRPRQPRNARNKRKPRSTPLKRSSMQQKQTRRSQRTRRPTPPLSPRPMGRWSRRSVKRARWWPRDRLSFNWRKLARAKCSSRFLRRFGPRSVPRLRPVSVAARSDAFRRTSVRYRTRPTPRPAPTKRVTCSKATPPPGRSARPLRSGSPVAEFNRTCRRRSAP